jgi:DNA-binding beta-propeller fold protein YncE
VTGGLVFAADGKHAYAVTSSVDRFIDAAVWEIDTDTQTVTRRPGSGVDGSFGAGIALTADESRVYGTAGTPDFRDVVWIADIASFEVVATRDLDDSPGGVAIATIQRPDSPRPHSVECRRARQSGVPQPNRGLDRKI